MELHDFETDVSGMPAENTNRNNARQPDREVLGGLQIVTVGGLPIHVLDREEAARLLIRVARERKRGGRPFFSTSANGEVIVRAHADPQFARMLRESDQILADGQPMVTASRRFCPVPLPERVATTDLFHNVAALAETGGDTFYLLGASEAENSRAVAIIRARYPRLRIAGHSHGYLQGAELDAKIREIDALAPDILWLGMGVPREQLFVEQYGTALTHVGVIKTAGGLFDHISGKNPRAPRWMQQAGFEWLWRTLMEPRRLLWRYLSTNPRAIYLLLTKSG